MAGYLSKRLSATELVNSLEHIHKGEIVVSEEPARLPLIGGDWPGREEGLTARESEVLCLITQGLTNAQIVERTQLSINSIKSYIRSCYRKIGVDSRSRAVLWGVDHGMQFDRVRVADPDVPGARSRRLAPGGGEPATVPRVQTVAVPPLPASQPVDCSARTPATTCSCS